MDRFFALTGRRYRLCEYSGAPDAERVIVVIGSASGAIAEAVERLNAAGEKVGLVSVRLYRPFPAAAFARCLPPTTRAVAVLDRTKEPGALGEPLYQDVLTALWEGRFEGDGAPAAARAPSPRVIGGRYGLASKELTPAMAAAIFEELDRPAPRRHFTVGIHDDVTGLSLHHDPAALPEPDDVYRAVFFALGGDGTVGANKNTVKIVGEETSRFVQGYFVYDSKKSGSVTVSHLRFSPRPIHATYLVREAQLVACHQFHLLERIDVLGMAGHGATVLLNSPHPAASVWRHLPPAVREQIRAKELRLFVVDGYGVARAAGLGPRINTVLQTCFFALTDLLPLERAIAAIEQAAADTYGERRPEWVARNVDAVRRALDSLAEVAIPGTEAEAQLEAGVAAAARFDPTAAALADAPEFVQRVTRLMLAGKGDLLPVSALPVDGTFPTGTGRYEKRSIASEIPIWDAELCIECGLCALVCPHAAIRMKAFPAAALADAPAEFPSRAWHGRELLTAGDADWRMTIQVFPDDCTGCAVCVDVCPAKSKSNPAHRAIDMESKEPHLERERARLETFLRLPETPRRLVLADTIKGSQLLEPLFEASGACAGCGETPYLKLLTQLFGDRLMIANATGCSSIFGGSLPTTPWSPNAQGRGPAWANSLFEDNAEFGLGMRLALERREAAARAHLAALRQEVGAEMVDAILAAAQHTEAEIAEQRERVARLERRCAELATPAALALAREAGSLVRRSVWIVGGDGWAYDIGFGGVDHVLASGRDVNLLVLDTEVYSNTGGQASKSTPRGAVAKFAGGGKPARKKDLGLIAMAYGDVYVAQIALGANPLQALRALREAEAYPGPSLVIAYSHCIAHDIEMSKAMHHQRDAVTCGYWPLYRFDPRRAAEGEQPLHLDSRAPTEPFAKFAHAGGSLHLARARRPRAGAAVPRAGAARHRRAPPSLRADGGDVGRRACAGTPFETTYRNRRPQVHVESGDGRHSLTPAAIAPHGARAGRRRAARAGRGTVDLRPRRLRPPGRALAPGALRGNEVAARRRPRRRRLAR